MRHTAESRERMRRLRSVIQEARAAADWATKEELRCVLLIDAEAHGFLPCFPSACTVFIPAGAVRA
ncbi:MAG: hypothetical protein ACLR8L_00475 [Oscillospiraceae bacterium]